MAMPHERQVVGEDDLSVPPRNSFSAVQWRPRIKHMSLSTETSYSSSNGDRWQLVHDGEYQRYVVRHEPNLSSGGEVSEFAVPEFLAGSGRSPQATALRELLRKQAAPEADITG